MPESVDRQQYTVIENGRKFDVRAESGRTIMVCADAASAAHYAQMLNAAFKAGYKQGLGHRK